MRNGFTFKNRHSSAFGVTVKTKSRPIRPAVKRFTIDMPYRDGEYDFSASNPQGREYFENRTFTVTLGVGADSLGELQQKISELTLWLNGSGELVFDDIPLVVWQGAVFDEVIYMPEHGGKSALMEVNFRVYPFGKCSFGTEGAALGDPLPIGSELPIGLSQFYEKQFSTQTNIDVVNFGDRPIRPVIEFSAVTGKTTLTLGDRTLSFTASGAAVVDFDKQTVTCGNNNISVTGEFFEFQAGKNSLNIRNSSSQTVNVKIKFKPEFMYGAVFDGSIWSDDDA